jgi:DNA-directed RNA polymerase subunit alpha
MAEPAAVNVKDILASEDPSLDKLFEVKRAIFVIGDARREFDALTRSFKSAVQLSNENKAEVRRATCHWLNGEVDKAIPILTVARPSRERDFVLGSCYLEQGKLKSAVETLRSAYEADRDDPHAARAYAEALILSRQDDEADKALERLEKKRGSSAEVPYLRGLLLDLQGFHSQAIEKYEQALDLEADFQPALFRMAYKYDLMGLDDRAMEFYDQIRLLRPLHVNTMLNLGVIYEDRGEYSKAMECFEAVLEYYPNHWRAQMYFKDAHASLQMYYDEEALKKEERRKQLASQHIADMTLSTRAKNALVKSKVFTLADLVMKTEEELLEVPGLGQTAIKEIKELLNSKHLSLSSHKEVSADEYLKTVNPEIQARALSEFEWSGRVKKLFEKLGFVTVGDLIRNSETDLLKHRNFGSTSLKEIGLKLNQLGVELRPG